MHWALWLLAGSALACRGPAPAGHDGPAARAAEVGAAPEATAAPNGPPPPPRPADDPPEAREARERLVREIAADRPWAGASNWDPRVLAAMRMVPRHLFMPGASLRLAYSDHPQ